MSSLDSNILQIVGTATVTAVGAVVASLAYKYKCSNPNNKLNINNLQADYDKSQYDIVVQCDKLGDLNKQGWNVKVRKELFPNQSINKLITENDNRFKRVVAVSGMYNAGKTFVINCLAQGYKLPEGFNIRTEGLSIKRLQKPYEDVLLLDTAGTNSAIKIANDESLSDKISCERILSNVLNDLADFHICVVNRLTWQDQRHYEELFHEIDRSHKSPGPKVAAWPLFIIHNYREHNLDDLKELVNEIKQFYPDGKLKVNNYINKNNNNVNVEEEFLNEVEEMKNIYKQNCDKGWSRQTLEELKKQFTYEFWFDSKGSGNVRHLFLVKNEGAGKLFNWRTLEYLRTTIHNSPPTQRGFGLSNLMKVLNKQVRKYCTFKNMDRVVRNGDEVLDIKANMFNDNKDSEFQNLTITLHPRIHGDEEFKSDDESKTQDDCQNEIILKKPHELAYNTLFSIATEWRPRYDITYQNDECLIVAEIPGIIKGGIDIQMERDVSNHNVNVKFSGIREYELCYNFNGEKHVPSSDDSIERQMGRFDCSVVVSPEYQLPSENSSGSENGVYWIKLVKLQQKANVKLN